MLIERERAISHKIKLNTGNEEHWDLMEAARKN
jgi:hypothetical protein